MKYLNMGNFLSLDNFFSNGSQPWVLNAVTLKNDADAGCHPFGLVWDATSV